VTILRGIVVSDLHAGSIYGLLPPDFTTFDRVPKPQNAGQKYLWDCWLDFAARAAEWKPNFVIVNGDCVDGMQHKNHGSELSLISSKDQKRAAIETLELLDHKLPGSPKWYFTQGTPYHVGNWGVAEEEIAEALHGELYSSIGTGDRCREILWLNVGGVIIEAAHHISVSTGFYRSTAMDREMQWSAMSGKDASKGVPKVDLVIRSHVHYFNKVEHASKQGVTTPCWQLQTRYMRKNSTTRMLPDIGGLKLEIDPAAKQRGEAPVRVVKELYHLPSVKVTTL
jgi:hypothetical protein